jgi:hypothetical protein
MVSLQFQVTLTFSVFQAAAVRKDLVSSTMPFYLYYTIQYM